MSANLSVGRGWSKQMTEGLGLYASPSRQSSFSGHLYVVFTTAADTIIEAAGALLWLGDHLDADNSR